MDMDPKSSGPESLRVITARGTGSQMVVKALLLIPCYRGQNHFAGRIFNLNHDSIPPLQQVSQFGYCSDW